MTDMNLSGTLSRRRFIKTATALSLAHAALGMAQEPTKRAKAGNIFAYVGTYSIAVDGGSNGEGIYLFEVDVHTGELTHRRLAAKTPNPSWIAIHPSKKYLYAVNEIGDAHGNSGSVSAFTIDPATGDLTGLNTVSSEGAMPAHMSIDATGKYAFVANYGGGSVAVLPILVDGSLGPATDIHRDSGSLGGIHATHASPGSFAISGHDSPHAHMIASDPHNKFIVATDLGQDRIYIYRFDPTTGKLSPSSGTPIVQLPSGDGPRHFVFHPNGHWFYSLQEEASTVAFYQFDPATGSLASRQTISTLPAGFAGTSFGSEILVSPDGKYLYAVNRLHDTIAVFTIGPDGSLKYIGETSTSGDYPRHCAIDPTGKFLFACNQRSDNITSYRIHADTGLLTFTGQYTPVGTPSIITFLA